MLINSNNTVRNPEYRDSIIELSRQTTVTRRAQSWMTTLRKVNRGLIGKTVGTSLGQLPHPARTDGKDIQFNTATVIKLLQKNHRRGVAALLGLNYHECSHILYSPSAGGSPLVTRLRYRAKERNIHYTTLFTLCNVMEDQRIETLFTNKYRRARHYFTVLVTDELVGKDSEAVRRGGYESADPAQRAFQCYALTMGRLYLPAATRDGFRKVFVEAVDASPRMVGFTGEYVASEVYRIYKRYASEDLLGTSAAQKRAADLVADLYDFIVSVNLIVPQDTTGHGEDAPDRGNPDGREFDDRPDVSKDVKDLQEDLENEQERRERSDSAESDADGDEDGDEVDADGSGGADGEGETGESDGEPAQPADDSSAGSGGEGEDDESDSSAPSSESNPSDSSEEGEGGNGIGTGGSYKPQSIEDLLNDALKDAQDRANDALNNDEMREEYERLTDSTEGQAATPDRDIWATPGDIHNNRYGYQPDLPKAYKASDDCEDVLRRMRADAGSYWERGVDAGRRINPLKFHGRQPWELNFWDEHEEGQEDEFNMEVVILLDQSGSMSGHMRDASAAVWAVHKAFHAIGANVWVIGYSDEAYGLIKGTDRPTQQPVTFRSIGGTTPIEAVKEARRILTSPACADKSKYLVSITDGAWGGEQLCDAEIMAMNNAGVITSYVYFGDNYFGNLDLTHLDQRHFHQAGVNLKDISLLPQLMEQIVRLRLAQVAR